MIRLSASIALCGLLLAGARVDSVRACTCFVLDTPEGPVFGANLDLFIPADGLVFINRRGIAKEGFQPSTNGVVAKWVSKHGSVTFSLAGREMAFGGMNEAGLVVGAMEILASEFPEPDQRPGLTIGQWAQYVLDTCATVEEAAQVDGKVRIEDGAPPIHYLIADAKGDCVAIEWMDGETVTHIGKTMEVKAMSNMPYDRALGAFKRGGPRFWWSNPGRSAERFADAHNRCQNYDATRDTNAVDYAFSILTETVAAPHTKWSIVYNIPKREIWYGSVRSRSGKHISMSKLDFACDAPLLMLDVNADLKGDVENAFKPYDHDENLTLFRNICTRYEVEISESDLTDIVSLFEGFKCAE